MYLVHDWRRLQNKVHAHHVTQPMLIRHHLRMASFSPNLRRSLQLDLRRRVPCQRSLRHSLRRRLRQEVRLHVLKSTHLRRFSLLHVGQQGQRLHTPMLVSLPKRTLQLHWNSLHRLYRQHHVPLLAQQLHLRSMPENLW